jgi:hypothetical protein
MKPVDKIVINYLRNKFKIPHDVVIDVKNDPSSSIKTMNFKFDLAKTDVNSGESEEWYQNFFLKPKRLTGMHSFLHDWGRKIEYPINEFLRIAGINKEYYRVVNEPVNYGFLDGVSDKIENAIKETDFPDITIEFSKDSDPDIKILFRGFTNEQFEDKDMFKEFTRQLKDVLGDEVDLSPYILAYTRTK